jgi:hypothetical protein
VGAGADTFPASDAKLAVMIHDVPGAVVAHLGGANHDATVAVDAFVFQHLNNRTQILRFRSGCHVCFLLYPMNMIPAGSTTRRKATEIVDLFDNPVGYLPTCGWLQVLQFRNLKAAKLLFYKEFIQKLKFLNNSSINPGTEILKGVLH